MSEYGGWIPDIELNNADARILSAKQLRQCHLNTAYLRYFEAYRSRYFYDEFIYGQGTEQILELLAEIGQKDRWLDVGCGTTTLFWSIPLAGVGAIDCCDISVEASRVLLDFVLSDEIPGCYEQTLAMCKKVPDHLRLMRERFQKFFIFDVLQDWPLHLFEHNYDLVTGIGIFGLAKTAEGYMRAIRNVAQQIRFDGYMVGADWVRSGYFIEREHFDNSYLDISVTTAAAEHAGLKLIRAINVDIKDDPLYSKLIVWALRRQTARS